VQRHWTKVERPAEARLNARRGGLLQRLSTALLTEFVGGFGKAWIAVFPTANTHMAFCPQAMDSLAVDGLGFGLVLLVRRSSNLDL
jgi:hypothetical protein